HRSITRSEKIARQLNLRFLAVNIGRRDYLRHLPTVCKILGGSISDLDLPAAAFLLAQLRSKSVRTVLSGMGSDEAFRLKRSQAARFPTRQIKQALADHQALARHYGLAFRCPYLSSAVVRQIVEAAPGMKKNKSALVQIVAEQPALLALLKGRPAEHSSIPDNFWRPFSALHRYLQPTK
ncbi:MAG: hypothetical protein HGA80_07630, partial [Candidatus Omnitrophica bacterium]|nr:hypothetical protein [Candidatus Omnitrophota bacterium]